MASASQATTVSEPDASPSTIPMLQSPEPNTDTDQHAGAIHAHDLAAMVTWREEDKTDGAYRTLCVRHGLMFDLHHDDSSHTAFFKLKIRVNLKAKPNRTTKPTFYLFIAPRCIQTLALGDQDSELGPDTVCLRFVLCMPPALITPKGPLACNKKVSGNTWDALRSLARVNHFDIYARLPARVVSRARLLILCHAASDHSLASTDGQGILKGLYSGVGGQVFHSHHTPCKDGVAGTAACIAGVSGNEDRLPSYDETEPGPPIAPVLGSDKRRRDISDTGDQDRICSMLDRMKEVWKAEIKAEMNSEWGSKWKAAKDELRAELGARICEIEESVDGLVAEQEKLQEQLNVVEIDAGDLIQANGDKIKAELYIDIRDELHAGFERLRNSVLNASFNIVFNNDL